MPGLRTHLRRVWTAVFDPYGSQREFSGSLREAQAHQCANNSGSEVAHNEIVGVKAVRKNDNNWIYPDDFNSRLEVTSEELPEAPGTAGNTLTKPDDGAELTQIDLRLREHLRGEVDDSSRSARNARPERFCFRSAEEAENLQTPQRPSLGHSSYAVQRRSLA
jgi:hypothetical protein